MDSGRKITEVAAALIWLEGKFLICRRPADKARALLWEFVGGKLEPGETGEEALIRECKEELDITVKPMGVFADVTHVYPDLTVHLTLYNCTIAQGEPKLLEHADMAWITPAEIGNYEFCPADVEILGKIRQEYAESAVRIGKYRHFKGMEYEVIAVAKHSETLEPMVVYRALYGEHDVWVRPASMWNQTVERDGQTFQRFTYIGNE